MKQVFCLGDSIRLGYEPVVVKELSGWANVTEMGETQGGDTRNVLLHLDDWVLGKQYDIVHMNAGLHDMIREVGPGPETRVPLAEYQENLRKIFGKVRQCTQTKLIFGLTTPVNLAWQLESKYPCNRTDEDVQLYNRAAVEAAGEFGVQINDLYTVVIRNGMEHMHDTDGAHFTAAGSEILGKHVAAAIRVAGA